MSYAILCLRGCGARGVDGSLFKTEIYASSHVERHSGVVHGFDGAMKTADGHDSLSHSERIAEVIDFLCFPFDFSFNLYWAT